MPVVSGNLEHLPKPVLRSILTALGGAAILQSSEENYVSRTQQNSLRSRIVEKIAELQAKHGTVLTKKFNIIEPARAEYIAWYKGVRADDIVKNPDKDYNRWAIVHLQDAIKYRKELVTSLDLKATAVEPVKEAVPA